MAPTSEIGGGRAGTLVGILRPDAFDVVVMNTSVVWGGPLSIEPPSNLVYLEYQRKRLG
jgi:hypothetical protein